MKERPIDLINNVSFEIKAFTFIISVLLHLILFLITFYSPPNTLNLRNPGVKNGQKSSQLFLKKKSEQRGEDVNLSELNPIGKPKSLTSERPLSSLSSRQNFLLPSPNIPGFSTTKADNNNTNILIQKIKGKDVQVPQGMRFSEKSKHAFDGSMFDVGIVLPEGISEDELNRFEEMFYSFRKRVAEQYINQILRLSSIVENRYPRTAFPWTNKTQILKAKLTYNNEGNLERIEFLQKTEAKILQEFYQEVMNNMNKIPNPPRAILNNDSNFELIFGLNIIE